MTTEDRSVMSYPDVMTWWL